MKNKTNEKQTFLSNQGGYDKTKHDTNFFEEKSFTRLYKLSTQIHILHKAYTHEDIKWFFHRNLKLKQQTLFTKTSLIKAMKRPRPMIYIYKAVWIIRGEDNLDLYLLQIKMKLRLSKNGEELGTGCNNCEGNCINVDRKGCRINLEWNNWKLSSRCVIYWFQYL